MSPPTPSAPPDPSPTRHPVPAPLPAPLPAHISNAVLRIYRRTHPDVSRAHPPIALPDHHVAPAARYILSNRRCLKHPDRALNTVSFILLPDLQTQPLDSHAPAFLAASGCQTSGVCGVVWKEEEFAYKCRTCERDPTCVICEQCFRAGDHVGHDFAMVRTTGGCCDCGDPQAWNSAGFCPRHRGPLGHDFDPAHHLDSRFRVRLCEAIHVVAANALSLILDSFTAPPETANPLAPRASAMLDWLTSVAVGDILLRVLCNLLTDVAPPWLMSQIPSSTLQTKLALTPASLRRHSWLSLMMRMDGHKRLPKPIQASAHSLYFRLITDVVFKRKFFQLYIANYERYIHSQVAWKFTTTRRGTFDDERDLPHIVENFSGQLLTVPALVPYMVCEGGMLDVILNILLNIFEMSSSPVNSYDTDIPFEDTSFAAKHPSSKEYYASKKTKRMRTSSPKRDSPVDDSTHNPFSDPDSSFPRHVVLDLLDETEGCFDDDASDHEDAPVQDETGDDVTMPDAIGESVSDDDSRRLYPDPFGVRLPSPRVESIDSPPATAVPEDLSLSDHSPAPSNGGDLDTTDLTVHTYLPREEEEAPTQNMILDDDPDFIVYDEDRMSAEEYEDAYGRGEDSEEEIDSQPDTEDNVVVVNDQLLTITEELGTTVGVLFHIHQAGGVVENEDQRELVHHYLSARRDQDRTSSKIYQQIKVFEDGLRFPPTTQISAKTPPPSSFRKSVMKARIATPHATSGRQPLTHPMRLDWSGSDKLDASTILWEVLRDLQFVLSHEAAAYHFLHGRKEPFRLFVRIVSMLQGMNPSSRRFGDHDPVWNEVWSKLFRVEMEIHRIPELCIGALSVEDPSRYAETLGPCFKEVDTKASRLELVQVVYSCLDEWLTQEEYVEQLSTLKGEEFTVAHAQSVHFPLHRLLSFLLHYTIRVDRVDVSKTLGSGRRSKASDWARLTRHPFRIMSYFAQVRAGMWRRNGRPTAGQLFMYTAPYFSEWFVDMDIFLLQCGALMIPSNEFITLAMNTFRIKDFGSVIDLAHSNVGDSQKSRAASKRDVGSSSSQQAPTDESGETQDDTHMSTCPEEADEKVHSVFGFLPMVPMQAFRNGYLDASSVLPGMGNSKSELSFYAQPIVEELLILMIRICGERTRCGYSGQKMLRSQFVHELATEDKPFSEMTKGSAHRTVESDMGERECGVHQEDSSASEEIFEKTLNEVATHIRPKGMSQGLYRLKDSMWREFDPFCPHLNRRERCSAEVRYGIVADLENRKPQPIPLHRICDRPLYDEFKGLYGLTMALCSAGKNGLVTTMLQKFLPKNGVVYSIEGALGAALNIVCMAVEIAPAPEHEQALSQFVNSVKSSNSFASTAFGGVCELAALYSEAHPDLNSEYSAVFERVILQMASCVGGSLRREVCRKVPRIVSCDALGGVGSSRSREEQHKEMLQRRKREQQAVAMASILRAQADFAKFMDDDEEEDSEMDEEDGQRTSTSALEVEDDEDDAEVKYESDDVGCDQECVLCHGRGQLKSSDAMLGMIGFHQETRVASIANNICESNGKLRSGYSDRRGPMDGSDMLKESSSDGIVSRLRQSPSESALGEIGMLSAIGSRIVEGGVEKGRNMHIKFCGHAVHVECFESYFQSLAHSRENQAVFVGSNVVNLDKKEFLCPVCRRLSNIILPIEDSKTKPKRRRDGKRGKKKLDWMGNFEQWVGSRGKEIEQDCEVEGVKGRCMGRDGVSAFSWSVAQLMKEFCLVRVDDDSGREVQEYEILAQLATGVMSTVASVEIGSRMVDWKDSQLQRAVKSVSMLFRATRAHISIESGIRIRALRILWRYMTDEGGWKRDGFVCVCLLMLVWSWRLSWEEVKMMVRLGLEAVLEESKGVKGGRELLVMRSVVYLRRMVVLGLGSGVMEGEGMEGLRRYDVDTSMGEVKEELEDLLERFGLKQDMMKDIWKYSGPGMMVPRRVGLVWLPREIRTVMGEIGRQGCGMCGRAEPKSRVMCLVCGEVVCGCSVECAQGGAEGHAGECGAGVGVLLTLKRTTVEIRRGDRRTRWGSPYLDAHGEEDKELSRGKALLLSRERYKLLESLWVFHAFDEDSYILNNSQTLHPLPRIPAHM